MPTAPARWLGSVGKYSTIIQYSLDGLVKRMFSVQGHNDGLRVVGENYLWALQNEDANPNLAVIDLQSGLQRVLYPPAPHGGGYDDLRVTRRTSLARGFW